MFNRLVVLVAGGALLVAPGLGWAQSQQNAQTNSSNTAQKSNSNRLSQADTMRIVQSVRKQILGLADYGVFDWLTFSLHGHTVVLNGYASRPQLKSEAEKVVKGIQGVQSVQNNIKVLPYSSMDDQIRVQTLVHIYGQPALRKYTSAPVSQDLYPSVARAAGGITQDPPIGYFAIHIIVDNGHVSLYGVVDSSMDAEIADTQANTVPGVFSVDDNLIVAGKQKEQMK